MTKVIEYKNQKIFIHVQINTRNDNINMYHVIECYINKIGNFRIASEVSDTNLIDKIIKFEEECKNHIDSLPQPIIDQRLIELGFVVD